MGIIVLLILFVIAAVVLGVSFIVFIMIIRKKINWNHFFKAFILSLLLITIIMVVYVLMGRIYAFRPYYDFALYLIILPCVIALPISFIKNKILSDLGKIILLSVIISGLVFIPLGLYVLDRLVKSDILNYHY